MRNSKSKLLIIATLIFASLIFASCSGKKVPSKKDKLKVVCTIYPEYDWAKAIIGNATDKVDLSLIVKNGVDLHSFQPSTADVVEITTADVFIYIGGISDNWVSDVLANSKNENMIVVNLMDAIGDRIQIKEVVEGMETGHDHEHEGDIKFNHTHNEPVYDEHIWLSLENAKLCCAKIGEALCNAAPSMTINFSQNCSRYMAQLKALSDDFANYVNNAKSKTLIFCDRFPFRYLIEDYGLNYYAAFSGCSAETEASFETIAFLSNKVQTTGTNAVFTIENSDNKIANTVIENSKNPNCKIITLDSMQATTLEEAMKGKTYIGTMKDNLNKIKTALK